jgi:hypothetical protein
MKAMDSLLEYGVLGAFSVLLIVFCGLLLWILLKDKDYQKNLSKALTEMVSNQKTFTNIYETSQLHHNDIIKLITQDREIDRTNASNCYNSVDKKLTLLLSSFEKTQI